jgi:transposase InsO family protein
MMCFTPCAQAPGTILSHYPRSRERSAIWVAGAGAKIYPYLLRDIAVERPNQVWAADIMYIPLGHGFLYLVAVMDWSSRAVLSWRLSNTMDVYEALTGHSLRQCPHCHTGIMAVIGCIERTRICHLVPDTS